ncbi:alternative ribosome rescue aminoacyl-tRNA hydrolase ArfB [Synechococcus sp. HB1133]|uniref:alternative ribosome rescue aminoacyl-tRNA hydrolase ArfB n=1 Tax=unclassified Synechococcus TaxID=2626047 RepID=UPI00140D8655
MVQDLVVNKRLTIPARDLRWRFSRSSGPGGQGVNTTDSRVELVLDVEKCSGLGPFRRARLVEHFETRLVEGCLRVVVAEERSQWQNRQKALHRMAELLREGLQPPPRARKSTRPGRGAVKRRLDTKKKRGDLKRQRRSRPFIDD